MRFPKIKLSTIVRVLDLVLGIAGIVRTKQGKDPAPWQEVGTVIRDVAAGEAQRREQESGKP